MRGYCGNFGGKFRSATHPMTSPIYLTPRDVAEITGKRRYLAQARALARMGVRLIMRPDGSPVVTKLALDAAISDVKCRP